MSLQRREFLYQSGALLIGFVGLGLVSVGCAPAHIHTRNIGGGNSAPSKDDDEDDKPKEGGNCLSDGVVVGVEMLHDPNHSLVIPIEDIEAGVEMTYGLEDGGSGHGHTVVVTAEHFASLKLGQVVEVESSRDSRHAHKVTLSCK